MNILYTHCAGLDVHKKNVVACRIYRDENGKRRMQVRTFSTMTAGLLELADWLQEVGVTHVAMESTGEYWRPVYNILEGLFEPSHLLLVNARHIKNVPGRKTDVNDATWIAELLEHGLLRPSFVPPIEQRDLRDLTRHRGNFVRERATLVNRLQKVLEGANIKLGDVASDVSGVSGRAMLGAIIQGSTDPVALASLAKGRLRNKSEQLEQALRGRIRPHHRLLLKELLRQIESLEASITELDAAIVAFCEQQGPFAEAVGLLDSIPGVARPTAEHIISEIGPDMSRFPSAAHLCAWAGVAPGNHESAGKRLSGRTRHGNPALRKALVQAAHAAAKCRQSYLSSQYHRLAGRRGKKRAILAVAHSILKSIYHMLARKQKYEDLGADYLDKRAPEATVKRLTGRLERMGYDVSLAPKAAAA